MFALFPPKKDFLGMLVKHADKLEEGLEMLQHFITEPTVANMKKVKKYEEEADELRRVLIEELNRTFVTPFDREDIFALSHEIDDIMDYANSTAEEMVLFNISKDAHIEKMIGKLHDGAKDINRALKALTRYPGVCSEHLIRARKSENSIEKYYREGLVELFESKDFIRILKTREVYRHLSNAADRVVAAANTIANVLIKMS